MIKIDTIIENIMQLITFAFCGVADGARTHDNRNHNPRNRRTLHSTKQTRVVKSIYQLLLPTLTFSSFLPVSVPHFLYDCCFIQHISQASMHRSNVCFGSKMDTHRFFSFQKFFRQNQGKEVSIPLITSISHAFLSISFGAIAP